jgi:zinc transport system ATP-binding protein
MDKPVIHFQNVFFSYGKEDVLRNASFDIFPNEFIGVIGPNGGGKTTALKLMMGFLCPSKGEITIFGRSPKEARLKIGYVPQVNLYDKEFPISVLEVVLTGCISKTKWFGTIPKEMKRKAREVLTRVGVIELQSRPFGSLSGGQTQKVLIARALISDPTLLLLDEPTANIDAESENAIFNLLSELKKEKTIVIVTHNFEAILKHAERILCFQQEVSSLDPQEVCKHVPMGMYHPKERA